MASVLTVDMTSMVEKLNLKNLTPDIDITERKLASPEINRPALQLTGFFDHFDRERLLALYRAGQHWLCAEYRRVDGSGNIRWVRHVLYLAEDPVSRQIYLFVYLLRLDPDRRLEYAIQRGARRDAVACSTGKRSGRWRRPCFPTGAAATGPWRCCRSTA